MPTKPLTVRRVMAAITAGAAVVALSAPAGAEHRPITDVLAVQAQLDLMTSTDRIPGALAQVRDRHGRSVTITSGTAELGTGRPMVGGDGRFRIASVTKPFTAVAVLRLVARHRVRLDAPVETYLPGVVRGTGEGSRIDGRAITVRQLLQHTSGLPDYTRFLNPTELVIRPAHLPDTYWPPAGERHIRGPHAHNYTVEKADPAGPLVDVTEIEPSWAGASGAMVSTPSDLNRFWQRLLGGRLLPRWALAEMQTTVPAPGLGPDMSYGLGLIRVTLPCGGQIWAHGGDLAGGGVANISGRADSGRAVTLYINALTGNPPATHLLRTTAIALCS